MNKKASFEMFRLWGPSKNVGFVPFFDRVLLVEKIILIFSLAAAVFYWKQGLSFRDPWGLYYSRVLSGFALYATGLVVTLLLSRLLDIRDASFGKQRYSWPQTLKKFSASYFNREEFFGDLRFVHAVSLMFVVFIQLKHLIPLVNNTSYDLALTSQERFLFGGQLAAQVLWQIAGYSHASWLSDAYSFWYPYMALMIVVMLLQRSGNLKREFFAAFVLVWFLGIFSVYWLPSLGPCFSSPEIFVSLPETHMQVLQAELWRNKVFLDNSPLSKNGVYLISGFPSLHLAAAILGSYYLSVVNRYLGLISWLFAAITALSTIYFGWHFLVDDVAAVFLVVLGVMLAKVATCKN